mmetsp:Transcript_21855/g.49805  ORF Transcript_21855/g.49805 Transcript_21855/m.49805 type:complete len:328 (+) Transcript_21855:950-1933(+)
MGHLLERLISHALKFKAHLLAHLITHGIDLLLLLNFHLLQSLLRSLLCDQPLVQLVHLHLQLPLLFRLLLRGVQRLLLQELDACCVPGFHLHQGTVLLLDAVHICLVPHRHHLLSEGESLCGLLQAVQLQPDVGNQNSMSTPTRAESVAEKGDQGGLCLRSSFAPIAHQRTQGGQCSIDVDGLPLLQLIFATQKAVIRACKVNKHQLASLNTLHLALSLPLWSILHAFDRKHKHGVRLACLANTFALELLRSPPALLEHINHSIRRVYWQSPETISNISAPSLCLLLCQHDLMVGIAFGKEVYELLLHTILRAYEQRGGLYHEHFTL